MSGLQSARPPQFGLVTMLRNGLWVAGWRWRNYGARAGLNSLATFTMNFFVKALNAAPTPRRRACPCCGWTGFAFKWLDVGLDTLPELECPVCRSHDRHRMLHCYLERSNLIAELDPRRILHFAVEPHLDRFFAACSAPRFVAADINPANVPAQADMRLVTDLMALAVASKSFDLIVCIHVLEHVADDRAGIRELARVLAPHGACIVMVPVDGRIRTTQEFGGPCPEMFDHMRNYAQTDFIERLEPFEVERVSSAAYLSPEERRRYRIRTLEEVYVCRRRPD